MRSLKSTPYCIAIIVEGGLTQIRWMPSHQCKGVIVRLRFSHKAKKNQVLEERSESSDSLCSSLMSVQSSLTFQIEAHFSSVASGCAVIEPLPKANSNEMVLKCDQKISALVTVRRRLRTDNFEDCDGRINWLCLLTLGPFSRTSFVPQLSSERRFVPPLNDGE